MYGSSFGFEASKILNKIVLGLAGAGKHGKWHRNGLRSASESGLTIKPCGPPALTLHFQFPPTVPFLYVLAPGVEWVAKPGLQFGEDLPSSWLDLLGDFGQCGCAGQGLTEGGALGFAELERSIFDMDSSRYISSLPFM